MPFESRIAGFGEAQGSAIALARFQIGGPACFQLSFLATGVDRAADGVNLIQVQTDDTFEEWRPSPTPIFMVLTGESAHFHEHVHQRDVALSVQTPVGGGDGRPGQVSAFHQVFELAPAE